jgi:hypothetical protein
LLYLSDLNQQEYISDITEFDIENETIEGYKRYAAQFIKGIHQAEWDVNTNSYSFLKSLGTFFVKIFQNGIFQSPIFLDILQEEMERDKASEQLK